MKKALKVASIIILSVVSAVIFLDYIFDRYSCDEYLDSLDLDE